MESADEFMRRYVKERAEWQDTTHRLSSTFHERYFGEPYLEFYRHFHMARKTEPEELISVEEDRMSAMAITMSNFSGETQQRYRYQLSYASGAWLIQRKEWECFACQGTRRGAHPSCEICYGTGWHDPRSRS